MDQPISFGYWVRRRRKALDLTGAELAQQVGCAGVTIRKIETDERRPSRQIAERLAACLQISPEDRAAFLRAARAELAVDRLATPPAPSLAPRPPQLASERPPRPQALKGYLLGEQLGAGGFGVVYRAEQPGVGRAVAIKIIVPEYANHPEFIRRFEAEAQLVARLEHPAIVPLYDYWRENGGAYLVMRYLPGGSLHAALARGPWSLEQTTRLLEQIGAALAFAHRHGVVHRDLKPANILLDADGNAYLADFGVAKDLHAANAVGDTQPGAVVGSPVYLSPEQLRDEPVTPQSDIYSLGVLLYEVLVGAHPFRDLSPAERLYQQLHTPLPSIRAAHPELPVALDAIVQRATAKAPADRYPEVVSLVEAWQRAMTSAERRTPNDEPTIDGTAVPAIDHPQSEAVTRTDIAAVENPYKGLRAFGAADAADFFGRAALSQRLLERLAEEDPSARFLAVVGPSGSGKSSVVRAGLIPALRRGGLPGSEQWFVIELLPGAYPFEELEAALLRIAVNPPESLLGQLREDERGLARAVKRVLPADVEAELVLVIDQFEELFTLTEDEGTRSQMLASLRAAVLDPHSRLRVVATLRADFYDRPLLYSGFGELMQQRTEVVLPLTTEELEQAIGGPAARVGVEVAPELVAAIENDVGEQPGTLPLLQYALTELFERCVSRGEVTSPLLTLTAYRETGGVRGALARRADEIYTALDAAGQAAARQLFMRLVTLGEGIEDTRRRTLRAELTALMTDDRPPTTGDEWAASDGAAHSSSVLRPPSAMDAVIDRYGRARLLSFDHDPSTREPTVEVAHEALIRVWDRLHAWLDDSRADIRTQRALAIAGAEWNTAGHDPSYLLGGARLAQFAGWAAQTDVALTQDERAFLETSIAENAQREAAEQARQKRELETARQLAATEQRRADEQSRAAMRLRRRALWLAGALLLALVAAGAAGIFAQNARTNLARSEQQRLAAQASLALDRGASGDLPALLALHSLRIGYSPEADGALLRALSRPFTRWHFIGHDKQIPAGDISPDGKYALTGGNDGTARLWDVQTGQQIRVFNLPNDGAPSVAFAPNGKMAITGSWAGTARLWDIQTGQELRQFTSNSDSIGGVAFSPDSKYALTGSNDKTAHLWDIQTGRELHQFTGHTDWVGKVAFSPDGKYVLTGSGDKTARLWNAQSGQEIRQFAGHTDAVNAVAFSPNGKYVLTGSGDKTARLWDTQSGQELRQFTGHTDGLSSVTFSHDGNYLVTGSYDKTARLWDVVTGYQVYVLIGHTQGVNSVAVTPNGKQVLTTSDDFSARLWEIPSETEPRQFIGHATTVAPVAFSPDGKQVLTGSFDQTARLWDIRTGQTVHVFQGFTDGVWSVAFSPDGKQLFTMSFGNTARLWDRATDQEIRRIEHGCSFSSAAFAPDGKTIFIGCYDGVGELFDIQTGQQIRAFAGNTDGSSRVAYSPDGKTVLTANFNGTISQWDVATGAEVRVFRGHTNIVSGVAFSPDGKYVLSSSLDHTARLWDVSSGQEIRRFVGHVGPLAGDVAFSSNGKYALTSGEEDKTVRLWEVATGQQLRQLTGDLGKSEGVAFSPDGKYVLTGNEDGIARLWRVDFQEVLQFACATLPRDLTAEERAVYSITDDAPTCPKL